MSKTTSIPGQEGTFATQRTPTPGSRRTDFWAVVLAGGEGVRLRSLVRSALGDERPKQYVPIFGGRTLLGQTLDRVGIGFAVDRTIVVTMEQHAAYTAEVSVLTGGSGCGRSAACRAWRSTGCKRPRAAPRNAMPR